MPICPRCGKDFSTNQSLTYHLSRKIKCNSYRCSECNKSFNTNHEKVIHETECKMTKTLVSEHILYKNMLDNCPFLTFIIGDPITTKWKYISKSFEKMFYPTKINDVIDTPGINFITPIQTTKVHTAIQKRSDLFLESFTFNFPGNSKQYKINVTSTFVNDNAYIYLQPNITLDIVDRFLKI